MNVQLYNHHYNTRDDKFVYEVLAVVVSFDGMGRWLYENKKKKKESHTEILRV